MLFLFICLLFVLGFVALPPFRQKDYHRKNHQTLYLLGMLVSFFAAVAAFILYISQDVSYYPTWIRYFLISKDVFRYISSKSFSKLLFARLLNVACIFFVFWSLQFALSFSRWFKAGRKVITLGAGILLAAEWAVYDPKMYVRSGCTEWYIRSFLPRRR